MRNVCSTDLHSSGTGRLRRQRGDKSLWIWNTEDARKQKQWRLHGLREDARGSGGLMCDAVCRDQAHHPAHLFHHLQQSQNLHQHFATPTPTLRLHFSPANSFLKFPLQSHLFCFVLSWYLAFDNLTMMCRPINSTAGALMVIDILVNKWDLLDF